MTNLSNSVSPSADMKPGTFLIASLICELFERYRRGVGSGIEKEKRERSLDGRERERSWGGRERERS